MSDAVHRQQHDDADDNTKYNADQHGYDDACQYSPQTRNVAIANRSRSASYKSFWLNTKVEIIHISRPTVVFDFVH